MKNFEKYYDELLTQKKDEPLCYIATHILNVGCGNCNPCHKRILKWLNEEHKEPIQLTHDEYIVLKNVDKNYKWIAKDNGGLLVFKWKPKRGLNNWWKDENGDFLFFRFNNLFQFIKNEDEEPYEIAKLIADYKKEHEDER